jgi:hypothetical protein
VDGLRKDEVAQVVSKAVEDARVVDVHTHLYPGCCGDLLLRGIDDLLTYHYLVVETLRYGKMRPSELLAMGKEAQADEIWRTLFVERSPVSEACRGVLTVLHHYGLDVSSARSRATLDDIRDFFASLSLERHINAVFEAAKIDYVVMTNDPFNPAETRHWGPAFREDRRFRAALRIDPLLESPAQAGVDDIAGFLERSADLVDPVYLTASLPPTFRWGDGSECDGVLKRFVLPFCRERCLPLALMIGVRRQANPEMGLGGDSVGMCSVETLEQMCLENPDNQFMITLLSRENQHALCVAARKFPNLMPFGCWWFMNNPSIVEEITRMRVELLGVSFIPQHSDARILDQLIYKWSHSKHVIAKVLTDKYCTLVDAGWDVTEADVVRDVEALFSGNANKVLGAEAAAVAAVAPSGSSRSGE